MAKKRDQKLYFLMMFSVVMVSIMLLSISSFDFAQPSTQQTGVNQTGVNRAVITQAPEFTHSNKAAWLNSVPLTLKGLSGKVILLDFWTFDCWNCYRSFPWLKSLEAKYHPDGLLVIGVHTPEFKHEFVRANVAKKIKEFGLFHPVMMDNDFSYWRALENKYWPTFYLIDKYGQVRGRYIGEIHEGDKNALALESKLNELLQEE